MKFLVVGESFKTAGGQKVINGAFAQSVIVGKSAFQIAKDLGYPGNEQEWNAEKNDLSQFAESAEQSATDAAASQTAAAESATNAATSETNAQAAATLATTYSLPHVTLSAVDYAALSPPVTGVLYITTSGVTL